MCIRSLLGVCSCAASFVPLCTLGPSRNQMPLRRSCARLDAFGAGMIWAMRQAGATKPEIIQEVEKPDGAPVTRAIIDRVIAEQTSDPSWRGVRGGVGGRPALLTPEQRKELVDLVFAERGKAVVTVKYCRQKLPFLREVSKKTVERALHEAGYRWMARRVKTSVPPKSRESRVAFATRVVKMRAESLARWCYTDGTTFYLARGPAEEHQHRRAALGRCVWRMANGKDGLLDGNIGPSLYAKSQGLPVKIWGLFGNGGLEYFVLPACKICGGGGLPQALSGSERDRRMVGALAPAVGGYRPRQL